MEVWQKLALESTLIDVNAWLDHAETSKAYCNCEQPRQHALETKALACAKRLRPGVDDARLPELVLAHCAREGYKNRAAIEQEKAELLQQQEEKSALNREAAEVARKEELRAEILKMKEEGLI